MNQNRRNKTKEAKQTKRNKTKETQQKKQTKQKKQNKEPRQNKTKLKGFWGDKIQGQGDKTKAQAALGSQNRSSAELWGRLGVDPGSIQEDSGGSGGSGVGPRQILGSIVFFPSPRGKNYETL